MVQASQYIYEKLEQERLIERAKNHCPERGTRDFQIVTVGHSLGEPFTSLPNIHYQLFLF